MSTAWNSPKGTIVYTISYEGTAMNTTRAHTNHQRLSTASQHSSSVVAKALPYSVHPKSAHIMALCVLAIGLLLGPVANAFAHDQACPPNSTGRRLHRFYTLLEANPNPATGVALLYVATDANHPNPAPIFEVRTRGLLPRNEPQWHICAWHATTTPINDPTYATVYAFTPAEFGHLHQANGNTFAFSNSRIFYWARRAGLPWNGRVIVGIMGLANNQNQVFRWYWVLR